ncbi:hypothetical protein [Nocardia sp. NPDC050793]|uniref:hypothetical protein n=1 Tax=Nocardia sp. NPDC050793 TaxID=3155159 RepID=UPI0033C3036B
MADDAGAGDQGPYWQAIVGDAWPTIDPALWNELATFASQGASMLDAQAAENAYQVFHSTVRESVLLRELEDQMLGQRLYPQAYRDVLTHCGRFLEECANLFRQIRNRITDIVDRTRTKISGFDKADVDYRDKVAGAVDAARGEVEELVSSALSQLPHLAPEALLTSLPGGSGVTPGPVTGPSLMPWAQGDGQLGGASTTTGVTPSPTGGPVMASLYHSPYWQSESESGPHIGAGVPASISPRTPSEVHGGPTDSGSGGVPATSGPAPAAPIDGSAGNRIGSAPSADIADTTRSTGDFPSSFAYAVTAGTGMELGPVPLATGVAGGDGRAGSGPVTARTGAVVGQSTAPAVASGSGGGVTSSPRRPATFAPFSGVRMAPSGPGGSAVGHPRGQADPPAPEPANPASSDELIRAAVGGVMITAAAPSFVVGDEIDGDLALARTILSGVLAATGEPVIGPSWAVSIMRHQSGISAFVTSTEGRGWLPAGLYLPREMSTPWVWSQWNDVASENVSDPARILAEFGIGWGAKRGARMSALASSAVIVDSMRRQLGDVSVVGEVTPASVLDLSRPAPGLVDRLGLLASSRLLDQVAGVPDEGIEMRCVELACDAHTRVGIERKSSSELFGVPEVRARILSTIRQGQRVSEERWSELRDADDLLAASMPTRRADVARIPLGQLRSEDAAGRRPGSGVSDAELSRAMGFERRCDELALLLAEEPDRQCLRDAVYAYGHIADSIRRQGLSVTS